MTPTQEQQSIIDSNINPGEALKILAYAGTGKTSTLCAVAERYPTDQILYLAFNKSVENDACMRFPCNTTAKTGHALAYKHVGRRYGKIMNLYNWQLAKAYQMPVYEASLLLKSYENFLCSADDEPNETHVLEDHLNKLNSVTYVPGTVQHIANLFDDMKNERNGIPMSHSCYLKMFQLEKPQLGFPIVLLDEAQDTNPVMHALVEAQMRSGSKVFVVGDSYQQIYSWRGAVDAMQQILAPTLRLTQSFRFGDAIAGAASDLLRLFFNEQTPLTGLSSIPSVVGRVPDTGYTVLCRTNGGLVREAYAVAMAKHTYNVVGESAFEESLKSIDQIYLMYANKRGFIQERRIAMHPSFAALKQYADESLDAELMSKVLIIEEYGSGWPTVREKLQAALSSKPDVLLSTCHKAKGLEWDNVRLSSDFADLLNIEPTDEPGECRYVPKMVTRKRIEDDKYVHAEEVNLIYVAATRAKKVLHPTMDFYKFNALEDNSSGRLPVANGPK